MEMDRLSALPDSLLVYILSGLGGLDLKEAARTSVLSKQWRFFWTDLPFQFWDTGENFDEINRFVSGVHAALAVASGREPALTGLSVSFHYDERFAPDVDSWLDFAAKNKLKHLNLILRSDGRFDDQPTFYTLPQTIYSNSSFVDLQLCDCIIASIPETTAVDWPYLRKLSLIGAKLGQREIEKILSGCPVLEDLEVDVCGGIERLEIGGRRFRGLMVSDYGGGGKSLLEISAPYMRELLVKNVRRKVRLRNTAALEAARIKIFAPRRLSIPKEMMYNTVQLFQDIRLVTTLRLSVGSTQVVSIMSKNGWRLPQFRLRELRIELARDGHNINGVLAMLDSSPYIERLVVNISHRHKPSNEPEKEILVNGDPTTVDDLKDDLLQLKIVGFIDFVNSDRLHESILTLVRILLKRAPVLEEIAIGKTSSISTNYHLNQQMQTLLSYPRSSQKVSVKTGLL